MTGFSFQLYSARNFPPLADVFSMLSRLGYASTEGYGGLYEDPAALLGLLDANGLTMPTAHLGLDQLRDRQKALGIARTVGIQNLFCPAISRELWDQPEEEWTKLAAELAELGKFYNDEGFRFGWHNHHFEFWPTASGRLPMDIILEGAPDIDWEADIAWIQRGEQDPRKWLATHGQRISAVHVKDIAAQGEATDEDGWADVGHGIMGWDSLLPFVRENTRAQHFVMEHDNPSDIERFAKRSLEAASSY